MAAFEAEDALHLPVFKGIFAHQLEELLGCIHARTETFHKGDTVLTPEQYDAYIGLIMEGSVDVTAREAGGPRPLARLTPYGMFGRGFFQKELLHRSDGSGSQDEGSIGESLPLVVTALEESTILFFDYTQSITPCWFSCFYHARFIDNAIQIAAAQNRAFLSGQL